MIEVMMAVAIASVVSLGIYKVTMQINSLNRTNQTRQLMQEYMTAILNRMAQQIQTAGDDISGEADISNGKTVISAPPADSFYAVYSPDLIFLSRDQNPVGSLGPEDYWIRYSTGVQNNVAGILETTYMADNWISIRAGTAPVVQNRFYPIPDGIHIDQLSFTLYDSQDPPRISNQDPSASSAVRVFVTLEKEATKMDFSKFIILENLLYGPK